MHFLKTFAFGALALASVAIAQARLAFTDVPGEVTAGQAAVLKYTAQDLTQPATITLRKGNPANLDTISVITTSAINGTYTWIPSPGLANATDYTLMITVGSEVNYSARFTLIGSSPSAVSSANAATSSSLSAGAALTSSASASALVSSLSSVIASYNSSLTNLTALTTSVRNATAVIVTPSLGTGIPITRNATLSLATLTQTSAAPTSAVVATTTMTTGSSSSAAAAATSATGAAATLKGAEVSGFALLAVGVVFFLQ